MTLVVTVVYLHDKLYEYNLMSKIIKIDIIVNIFVWTGMGQFDKYVSIKLVEMRYVLGSEVLHICIFIKIMIGFRKRSTTYIYFYDQRKDGYWVSKERS